MTAIQENRKIRKEQIKGVVKSIQAGTNITVDDTNPEKPIINADSNIEISSGSFEVSVIDNSGAATYNLGTKTGDYYRIGNLVTFKLIAQITSVTGVPSGSLTITGLPFNTSNSSWGNQIVALNISVLTGLTATDTELALLRPTISNSNSAINITSIKTGAAGSRISTSGIIEINGTYHTTDPHL